MQVWVRVFFNDCLLGMDRSRFPWVRALSLPENGRAPALFGSGMWRFCWRP